ncbi:MAG: magnesium and cobalt transport protein CorA, partial [Gemmatimonadota bacterium]|nr:magnesium and cobalt transport protein CorA [Gemmatimonadota bacterium]
MFHKQNPPAGSRPGTLAIAPGSPPPRIHVYQYSAAELTERAIEDVEELVPYARGDRTTWVDVRGLGDEAVLRRIAELFEIDGLSLEDAVNLPQRAKSEARDRHQVIIARLPILTDDGDVDTPQVCLLLGRT